MLDINLQYFNLNFIHFSYNCGQLKIQACSICLHLNRADIVKFCHFIDSLKKE